MEAHLKVLSGAYMDLRIDVSQGQEIVVGRAAPADLILAEDPLLSPPHFALRVDDRGCWLRDLGSQYGTTLNGRRVDAAFVPDRTLIAAGSTTFLVFVTHRGVPVDAFPGTNTRGVGPVATSPAPPLSQVLGAVPDPLFALLDAARSPRVLEVLRPSGTRHQSLYEGAQGAELADFAPYLVELPTGSALLKTLIDEGWGQSWGVYLTCPLRFSEVRKHFRHFLLVKSEENGRTLYFRFYDPRVLRLFLPTCNPRETAEFFGPVDAFLLEADDPGTLLRFTRSEGGAEQAATAVLIEASVEATR